MGILDKIGKLGDALDGGKPADATPVKGGSLSRSPRPVPPQPQTPMTPMTPKVPVKKPKK